MTTAAKPAKKTARPAKGQHPLAGTEMTGAEMAIQVLADEGVDTIFGYSGGAILPTYDAIFRYNAAKHDNGDKGIRLVVPANEQGAGFMAAGYARSTGKVGVFLVTSGPGATNAVTPIRDCMADSIPVVLICGQVPRAAIGTDAFQEAPVFSIMSACTKHTFLVSKPEELEATVRSAFYIARTGRPGPVVIDVPKDVQNWVGQFQGSGLLNLRGYNRLLAHLDECHVSEDKARSFFTMLARSERPLIYAGGGVIGGNASDALRAFAEQFQIPVVTTLMGIGSMDMDNPLALHMLGMHGTAYANYAVDDCDFLITVGARFDDRVAGKVSDFAPRARAIAHIDIDASELNKVKAVTWTQEGDAGRTLTELTKMGKKFKKDYSKWIKHVAELKRQYAMGYDRKSDLIQPQYVIECLNEATKGEAIVVTGVGQHQMWAAQFCKIHQPRRWVTSGSMGTMGFGLPAAIGAQAANPGRLVVDIDGDGSMRMNLGELETATTYGLPVKVLLFNNLGDGMVRQWQKLYFGKRFSGSDKSLHKKDFVKAAEADGFGFAKRVTRKQDVARVLRECLQFKGPAFLEIMIDPDACVYPMVGPGLAYKDMVTGDFIARREAIKEAGEGIDMMKIPDLF